MSDAFSTVESELPRDRWGRPLITPPEGGDPVAYMRVTTFVKALDDTFHLGQWQLRMAVLGMARRRDLQLAAAAIRDPDDRGQKKTLNEIAKQAKDAAAGSAAATTGTALHSFTESLDKGEELSYVPEEYVADLAAYTEVMRYFEVLAVEGFCVVDSLRVGGSYDRILRITEEGLARFLADKGEPMRYPDGELVQPGTVVIGDLKTGKSVDLGMGSISQQLGCYANAEDYDHTLGTRTPLAGNPSKKWALVIHLPAGKGRAELVWVDIEAGWWAATNITPLVHAWRKRKDLHHPFAAAHAEAPPPPSLVEQIKAATSYAALKALYAENATVWTPGLSSLAATRRKELEASG